MPRHIDADALKEKVRYSMLIKMGYLNNCADMGHEIDAEYKKQILANIDFHKAFIELIDKQPTIEAQPKTGKWINGHWDGDSNFRIDGRGNCWYVRECSNCHEEIEGKPTKYCPECGAKMEGD